MGMKRNSGIRVPLLALVALCGMLGFSAQAQASFEPISTFATDAVPDGMATADLDLDGNSDV